MPNHQRVLDLLVKGKDEAVAITGTERQPLTYSDLQRQIEKTIRQLNQLGVGRNDPVAIVLPNGPEMATAFVAIASGATTAPLNPAYREEEFDFYLSDLNTRLLVVEEGSQTPALSAAEKLGIPVARLRRNTDPAAIDFHIHGLMAAVLSSLAAGASAFCTPGFNALKFFSWMQEAQPSWYTAVPTMHQAILGRAARNREIIESNRLRFLRSSSASMPTPVMKELEETFNAPLIEAYGMTEASHQMASNPLPPGSSQARCCGPRNRAGNLHHG